MKVISTMRVWRVLLICFPNGEEPHPNPQLAGCVTLGNLLNLSVPQFPYPLNVDNNSTYLIRFLNE